MHNVPDVEHENFTTWIMPSIFFFICVSENS